MLGRSSSSDQVDCLGCAWDETVDKQRLNAFLLGTFIKSDGWPVVDKADG